MTTIGISGIGSIGARHARVFAGIEGVAVLAQDPACDEDEIGRRAGVPLTFVPGSFDALLDRTPDGVVLASPESAHVDQVISAAERDIPVLVEKPVAPTLGDARALAGPLSVPVLVGYVLRHQRCMARARDLIADGAIGTPASFHVDLGAYETLVVARSRFRTAPPGTIYVDYSHEWDYLRWWIDDIVAGCAIERTVTSLPLVQRPNVVEALLRTAGGTIGTVHLDYLQDPGHRRITVVGDGGTLFVDPGLGLVVRTPRGMPEGDVEDLAEPRDRAFEAQARHFLAVVRGEAPPAVTITDGLAALATADALRASAAAGTWRDVDLSWNPARPSASGPTAVDREVDAGDVAGGG